MTPINPLHPQTRNFLRSLYAHRAASLNWDEGVPLTDAKAEGHTLSDSFKAALLDGTLQDMGENVITRELAAGMTPEEFKRGLVFYRPVLVSAPQMRRESTNRETDQVLEQMRLGGEAA